MDSTDAFVRASFASSGTDASVEASLLKIALMPLCESILAQDGTDTSLWMISLPVATLIPLCGRYPCQ